LAVEAVGRLNLLALITNGYDGPSASEIADTVDSGTYTALLLQDPSGQMPCNGRTDDHVWGDVGYQLAFELMAQRALARGDRRLAGQYQHAAMLNIANIDRWRRTDIPWAGSYFVTKNHFDPKLRLGYQGASEYSNYNGSLMHHLAQAFLVRRQEIAEEPAPNEIGGYAFALDENFATAFANAGGTFLEIDLKADTALSNGNADYWSTLGVVRIGRPGWDTRLGPSDGGRAGKSGLGTSLCPAFEGNGKQFALASIPDRYHGRFSVEFVHPLLVRCNVDYTPIKPQDGPSFRQSFVLTPDGVLTTLQRTAGTQPFSLVAPLLSNDGQPLEIGAADRIAFSRYTAQGDEQNFIALNRDATLTREAPVRSTFGDLTPVHIATKDSQLAVFIYPRTTHDVSAVELRDSLRLTSDGFTSRLATVSGTTYVGPTSAAGMANQLDLSAGRIIFSQRCGFIVQLRDGRAAAIESDRDVEVTIGASVRKLLAFTPIVLK